MYIVIVLAVTFLCVETKSISGRAFLCRDPDTGKLHTVNSTWPSSTFCGNYHCKLRKKNITNDEFEPIRQINFSNFDIQRDISKLERLLNIEEHSQDHKSVNVIGISGLEKPPTVELTAEKVSSKPLKGDRYLTEKEIKTISAILHTMKKSDLEAIVEIYQLAQNIYDELDKTNPEVLIQETVNDLNIEIPAKFKAKLLNPTDTKRVSYWYDPISNNNKEIPINVVNTQTVINTTPRPVNYAITSRKPVNYFDGALTTKDFGKLPYYYPVSTFQRAASYVHQPLLVSNTPYMHTTNKISITQTTKRPPSLKFHKRINPSIFLPYPFFNVPHNYNGTSTKTLYHSKNYVDRYEMSNDKSKSQNSNAILINPDLENIEELGIKSIDKHERSLSKMGLPDKKKEEKLTHDWQTDPISRTILEEVRAHIDNTKFFKPLSLRKKIKLDRVSRVVKVDDYNDRKKRNADVKDELMMEVYEVYLDKTTCQTDDSVPGFFRYGNLSEPFPKCCPQRIGN